MSVKQFSANYNALEDRIIFSFNTTEAELYSFLLTRAIAKSLLNQAQDAVEAELATQHSDRSSKIIQEVQKDDLKKYIQFENHFDGGQSTPLGESPILITAVQITVEDHRIAISFNLTTNQLLGFSLSTAEIQMLCVLIEKLALQGAWQISAPEDILTTLALQSSSTSSSQLH